MTSDKSVDKQKNLAKKYHYPSINDIMFIVGIGLVGLGISFQWNWPIACIVSGFVIFVLAIWDKQGEVTDGVAKTPT